MLVCIACYSLKFDIGCQRKLEGHLKTLNGNRIILKDISSLDIDDEKKSPILCVSFAGTSRKLSKGYKKKRIKKSNSLVLNR